jgi:hypothetical protein
MKKKQTALIHFTTHKIIFSIIKSRIMKFVGLVAHIGEKEMLSEF